MAFLYVTEYATIAIMQAGRQTQVPQEPPLVEQAIAITAGSTQTAAFNAKTGLVRVHTDAICGVTFGTNPTATVQSAGLGSGRMAIGQTEYHGVPLGAAFKAAVIATT
jgi:tetrahydromethanopterin S-methyltransferase subunit C